MNNDLVLGILEDIERLFRDVEKMLEYNSRESVILWQVWGTLSDEYQRILMFEGVSVPPDQVKRIEEMRRIINNLTNTKNEE